MCKRPAIVLLAATVGLLLAAAAGAKTIVGTAHADVLRGGPGADSIYGRQGNDRLYGMAGADRLVGGAGNDRLVGGPGTDLIRCGTGHDRVIADLLDRVAGDCEVVIRPSEPPPPPPPPPPPGPTPALTPPGHYVASSNQGRYVQFQVVPNGRALFGLRVEYNASCNPPATLRGVMTGGHAFPIADDRSLTVDAATADGLTKLALKATFDGAGHVSGTFQVHASRDQNGKHFECDSGIVEFSGGIQ
jgi:Ca2+-binding RTX toxin-like protein